MGRTKTSRYRNWRKQMRKMEKAMDGVGWTALVVTGLLILLVIIVQVGKWFYGW